MKVSKHWLQELVDLKVSLDEVVKLLPLKTIGTKEVTEDFIELDMKGYNRADLLSLRGVAHEVAAITDGKVKFFEHTEKEEQVLQEVNLSKLDIEIENTTLCPMYCVAKIEGLTVESSSPEWAKKLADSGIRSINNLADITNLIMVEYGQPLHAFDANQVKDQKIVVRTAKQGEKLQTLDSKNRELSDQDIVIADDEKVLGLAGVMGGKDSEVTEHTKTILLEAAIFDPITLRKTASKMGLQSEASKRFQHGLTKKRLLQAFSQAIKMYQELGGKLTGIRVIDNLTTTYPIITLTQQKVNSLIGIVLTKDQIENYLYKLGFKLDQDIEGWQVTPPYYRLDIQREEDLIEEIARMYGYDKIPAKPLEGDIPNPIDQSMYAKFDDIRNILAKTGFTEIQTYSFYTQEVLQSLDKDTALLIKLENPMSAETKVLRDSLWPNLVEVVAKNIKQGFSSVAAFEIGKTYQKSQEGMPQEQYVLSIVLSTDNQNPAAQLYTLVKQVLQENNWKINFETPTHEAQFHPTRQNQIKDQDNNILGILAEVHLRTLFKLGINQRVGILEVTL